MESMGKKPRRRRSFTPEFKAEIVGLCQQGDRSVGQVARDFDLTETAVREWVKQSERDTGTRRARADADLTIQIRAVHKESRGCYGPPRVHAELRHLGHRHGRKRIARLMRSAGLAGRAARRWKKTTIADPAATAQADRIRRDFTADASKLDSRWCGDITYLRAWEGWLFVATVTGIASRRVVDYAMADHLRTSLVADAPGNAVAPRDPGSGVIFLSDRGCRYTLGYLSPAGFEASARKEILQQVA